MGMTVAVLCSLLIAACSGTQEGKTDAPETSPVVNPTAVASGVVPSSWAYAGKLPDRVKAINPDVLPKDTVESGLFDQLSAEQKANIKHMKEMSVEEFRELPLEQQLLFGQFVYDNNAPHTFKDLGNYGFGHADYVKRLKTPSPDNTPQEILDSNFMIFDVSMNLLNDKNEFDTDTARKMVIMSEVPSAAGFQIEDNSAQHATHGLTNSSITDLHGSKRFSSNGAELATINLTNTDKEDIQTTLKYTEFTDVWGQKRGVWRNILSIGPSDPRYQLDLK